MAIFPIIVHFKTKRAGALIHDVAWISVHSKDAQKQLAWTSLIITDGVQRKQDAHLGFMIQT